MALVILGGIATSTALDMLVVSALYTRFAERHAIRPPAGS